MGHDDLLGQLARIHHPDQRVVVVRLVTELGVNRPAVLAADPPRPALGPEQALTSHVRPPCVEKPHSGNLPAMLTAGIVLIVLGLIAVIVGLVAAGTLATLLWVGVALVTVGGVLTVVTLIGRRRPLR